MQLHYLSVLLLSSHHRKVCAKVGSSCLLEDRYIDIPYLGTWIYHICESKHCHDLWSYDLLYYETKLPFFGLENSYCDADALGFVCGVQAAGGWW